MTAFVQWLAALAEPLYDLFTAVTAQDEEAERQALLNLSRAAHDERMKRELGKP